MTEAQSKLSREMRQNGFNHVDSNRWGKCTAKGIVFALMLQGSDGEPFIEWPA